MLIDHSILAFGPRGQAVYCDGGVADPLFCSPPAGDFTLAQASPCAPPNSPAGCGLIGALGVGCVNPIGVAGDGAPRRGPARLRVLPNPLRSEGVVTWVSEAAGPAVLRLYDPAGRLVLARDLGTRAEGRHESGWAALLGARSLAAGVYFLGGSSRETGEGAMPAGAVGVIVTR